MMQYLVAQVPWGHNIFIFTKSQTFDEAHFYIQQTIENGWSRDVLALQIKLHSRFMLLSLRLNNHT